MFPLYTKTFGGKIGKNLHSVSPDNIFVKNFKMASLEIFPPKTCKQSLVQKKLKIKRQFRPRLLKTDTIFRYKTVLCKSTFEPNFLSKTFWSFNFFARDSVHMLTVRIVKQHGKRN